MFSRHLPACPIRLPPRLPGYEKSLYYNNLGRAVIDAWTGNGTGSGSKSAVSGTCNIARLAVLLVGMARRGKLRKLRALMDRYDVLARDVAKILGVSEIRVYGWLSRGQTTPIPDTKLRLLELELSQRKR